MDGKLQHPCVGQGPEAAALMRWHILEGLGTAFVTPATGWHSEMTANEELVQATVGSSLPGLKLTSQGTVPST